MGKSVEDACGYERYNEPYSYEVRDRRVRIARGLQAVDGLTTSKAFDEQARRYVEGEIGAAELCEIMDACYGALIFCGMAGIFSAFSSVAAWDAVVLEGAHLLEQLLRCDNGFDGLGEL